MGDSFWKLGLRDKIRTVERIGHEQTNPKSCCFAPGLNVSQAIAAKGDGFRFGLSAYVPWLGTEYNTAIGDVNCCRRIPTAEDLAWKISTAGGVLQANPQSM
jgi:hypothetical protein